MEDSKVEEVTERRLPPNAGKGRPPGVPNKSTAIVREAIANLLERNSEKMDEWLQLVAYGDSELGVKPQPDKALDRQSELRGICSVTSRGHLTLVSTSRNCGLTSMGCESNSTVQTTQKRSEVSTSTES
jgi:hypothetical protein